jgi:methylase of polypeptide subunit release factors
MWDLPIGIPLSTSTALAQAFSYTILGVILVRVMVSKEEMTNERDVWKVKSQSQSEKLRVLDSGSGSGCWVKPLLV